MVRAPRSVKKYEREHKLPKQMSFSLLIVERRNGLVVGTHDRVPAVLSSGKNSPIAEKTVSGEGLRFLLVDFEKNNTGYINLNKELGEDDGETKTGLKKLKKECNRLTRRLQKEKKAREAAEARCVKLEEMMENKKKQEDKCKRDDALLETTPTADGKVRCAHCGRRGHEKSGCYHNPDSPSYKPRLRNKGNARDEKSCEPSEGDARI